MKASEMILQLQNLMNEHGDFEVIKQGHDEGNYYDYVVGADVDVWNGELHDPLFESDLYEDEVIENGKIVGVIY